MAQVIMTPGSSSGPSGVLVSILSDTKPTLSSSKTAPAATAWAQTRREVKFAGHGVAGKPNQRHTCLSDSHWSYCCYQEIGSRDTTRHEALWVL
jgi:hypothetical protein